MNEPQMRTIVLMLLTFAALAGCDRRSPSAARPTVDLVFFYDDGTSVKKPVPIDNPAAADVVERPILATAFSKPPRGPRVVRWLIDDSRSGAPVTVDGPHAKGEFRSTISIYREYRVVPASTSLPAIGIQARHRPDARWADWASASDAATALSLAMDYLADDLKAVRELAPPETAPARPNP